MVLGKGTGKIVAHRVAAFSNARKAFWKVRRLEGGRFTGNRSARRVWRQRSVVFEFTTLYPRDSETHVEYMST